MIRHRLLRPEESDAAARLHRIAGQLIPGYDTSRHSAEEFQEFYKSKVMVAGPVWGAFEDDRLIGHMALLPGWIDHLYVDPEHHRRGVASALVALAQRNQDELQLYTFQSNAPARRLYERHGFVVVDMTSGDRNEERMPDVRYRWRRA